MVMGMATLQASITAQIFSQVRAKVPEHAATIFENCFSNTLDTAVTIDANDKAFVVTGDIPAMWLRDSTWQLLPYLRFLNLDEKFSALVAKISCRQLEYILIDPYANAFNPKPNGAGHQDDETVMGPWIWERKFEVDSLCTPIYLAYALWSKTGITSHLSNFEQVLETVLNIWTIEQDHESRSQYRFQRKNPLKASDTLVREGKGTPVGHTGMIWSGFRPSDDSTVYGYNIPDNAFAIGVLRQAATMVGAVHHNADLERRSLALADEIEQGLLTYGIVDNPSAGKVYAYEVDGLGHCLLMDDANLPSLLSLPLLGWQDNDGTYQRTREMVLSTANPYWYEGSVARGIGSPHTPEDYVWPIALCVQGLTSTDPRERDYLLHTLSLTDTGAGLMHESFDVNNAQLYTRPWFSWANAMYCEFVLKYSDCDSEFQIQTQRRGGMRCVPIMI